MELLAIEVFAKAVDHYGLSKFKRDYPSLELINDEDELLSGEYCSENNSIMINLAMVWNEEDLVRTVTHEYLHYLQSPVWLKRYGDMYDYYSSPYEKEAYGREHELLKYFEV